MILISTLSMVELCLINLKLDDSAMKLEEYVLSHRNEPTNVADVLLRGVPEAVAKWRSEQEQPQCPLSKDCVMVDEFAGYVYIVPVADAGGEVNDIDDVKAYGEMTAAMLALLPRSNRRVSRLIDACRRGEYASMGDVMLAVEKGKSGTIYWYLILIIVFFTILLVVLNC